MPTFAMLGTYSAESVRDISRRRTQAAQDIIKKHKGAVQSMHVLLGEYDLLFLVDFPTTGDLVKASIELTRETGISFATSVAMPVKEFDALVGEK
jgi:uncharacterized protein with GYD domain